MCEGINLIGSIHFEFRFPGTRHSAETDRQFLILIALPGVDPSGVTVVIDENALHIVGERPLMISRDTVIRRLEIPYGRFEKRISLPAGNYKMTENVLMNGCLRLVLNKLG